MEGAGAVTLLEASRWQAASSVRAAKQIIVDRLRLFAAKPMGPSVAKAASIANAPSGGHPRAVSDVPVQFVVGKGGVGKSTVTAALALESASRGLRTLAVEFGGHGGLSRLFDVHGAPLGSPVVVAPRLTLLSLVGDEALAEYLRLVVPIKRLLQAVFSSRLYSVFVAGAPGLKELMTVGKIWYEADRRMADGTAVWDRIFVDAGASGHSLQYLRMPAAAVATFRNGLVHREAVRVQDLLTDPARTCVHVVSIPEETPVTEACGIVKDLREKLGIPVGSAFMNRCGETPPTGAVQAVAVLQGMSVADEDDALRRQVCEAASAALRWHTVQVGAIARLESVCGFSVRRIPLLSRQEFALTEVRELAALMGVPSPLGSNFRAERAP